jgi:hypothetical protein
VVDKIEFDLKRAMGHSFVNRNSEEEDAIEEKVVDTRALAKLEAVR